MTWLIVGAVACGGVVGRLLLGPGAVDDLGLWVQGALTLMLFVVGLEIGGNRRAWGQLAERGLSVLAVPLMVAVGSLCGAAAAGWALGLKPHLAAAVGAGFGWYSLSGVLLTELVDPGLGALAFMTNVTRELLAISLAVPLARRLGPLAPVAAGGATAMDTTMPVIARAAGAEAALTGFLSGLLLTAVSPLIIEAIVWLGGS